MSTYTNILLNRLPTDVNIPWRWLVPGPIVGQWETLFSSVDNDSAAHQSYPLSIEPPSLFALVVGIDRYAEKKMNLDGPVADARAMKEYLESHLGVPKSQIRVMYNHEATRAAIIRGIRDLTSDHRIKQGDPILIYFAGHGGETDKPGDWEADGQKSQMIMPHDYLNTENNHVVHGIPGYSVNKLVGLLAMEKGDNITVIFDCCHSGSGTRKPVSNRRSRGVKVTVDIPADLDEEIIGASHGGELPSGFYGGCQSHVILAACNQHELAHEQNGRGVFTVALIDALVAAGAGKVTYSGLLKRLPSLPRQTPRCEGSHKHRILFNSKAPALGTSFYKVRVNGSNYTLRAGTAHGITDGAEFAIYSQLDDFYANCSVGSLVVQSASLFSSTLAALPCTTSPESTSVVLGGDVFALQTKVGTEEDLRLYIADSLLLNLLLDDAKEAIAQEPQRDGPKRWQFVLVGKETAWLTVSLENDHAVFDILNPLVTGFGLLRMPFRINRDIVPSVIQAAAHFDCYLRRNPPQQADFQNTVRLEFTKLVKAPGRIPTEGPNLNIDGNIDIVVDDSMYGVKLVNDSDMELYPYLFYFDCSDLSIEFYYDSATAQGAKRNAPLQPKGWITIGYDTGGWTPWKYSLRQPKELEEGRILQEKQDIDVGFFKLLLSTKLVDLSFMEQRSPFLPIRKLSSREGTSQPLEAIESWGTTLITFVQRKEIPEESPAITDVE